MTKELIDFYKANDISPVSQDIKNLSRHLERRTSLYRQLGILPTFIKGKRLLEVGPGSGYNSLHSAMLEPESLTLVEGNPRGVSDIEKLFSDFPELWKKIRIENVLLQEFDKSNKFDFVFCEGMLLGMSDPRNALRTLGEFVEPDGLLIVTCADYIAYFPEMLRRHCANLLTSPDESIECQLKKLIPIFSPHLSLLNGMSRPHEDWVIDNLINPAAVKEIFSIADVIDTLESKFNIYSSSPNFLTDWRWYKTIYGEEQRLNENAKQIYWEIIHNFLDHTKVFPSRPELVNKALYLSFCEAASIMRKFEISRDINLNKSLEEPLLSIISQVKDFSYDIATALDEARILICNANINPEAIAASTKFGSLFGRGQQYVSLSRRSI